MIVLERNSAIALEMTSRNSEVVHAGIYYPKASLKAELCIAGRRALYQRCEQRGIGHRRVGKLMVATDAAELDRVAELEVRGRENGVEGLRLIGREAVNALEPAVRAVGALHSPVTGIVDAHALSLSYQAEAEGCGAVVALGRDVVSLALASGHWQVEARTPEGEAQRLRSAAVVNAAGLASDRVAALAGIDIEAAGYRLHPCKGDYFALAPGAPLRLERLVYPVPSEAGLGVHSTLDLAGRIRFGPDATYVASPSYQVDDAKRDDFARAIGRYLPGLRRDWLTPDYAGVRPKLSGPGEPERDFVVAEESAAGLPGLVSCIGIESPGLTASPAIAARVAELLSSL